MLLVASAVAFATVVSAAQTAALCAGKSPILTTAGGDTAKRLEALIASGRAAFDKKDYDAAADSFEKATKLDPKSADAFLWYGNALGQRAQTAGSIKQAFLAPRMKHAWERAVELDPCGIEARASLIQFYTMAPGIMGGSMDKAKAEAQEIIAIDPYRGEIQLGNIAQREKDLPAAAAAYEKASKMPGDSIGGAWGSWVFTLEEQGSFAPAYAAVDARLAKDPGDLIALTLLGRASAMSGQRLPEGLAALKKVAAEPPAKGFRISPAGVHYRMGQIMVFQADTAGAMAEYQAGLVLDPKNKNIKEAIEKLGKK
jgi:tetratricopeptide (TPR) repeat protein